VAEAARQAGVSPGAPYRHFADREALLVAASRSATEQLTDAYRAALETSQDPAEQLAAAVAAHVRLAAATGIGFEIVYASGLDKSDHEELAAGGRELIGLLLPLALECSDDYAEALRLLTSMIALAHGYAGLLRSGFFAAAPSDAEEVAEASAASARRLLAGYRDSQASNEA
jgi:AcrR family transcriptional regulator